MLCSFCVCSMQFYSSHSGLRSTWRGISMMQLVVIAALILLSACPPTTIAAPLVEENGGVQKRSADGLQNRNLCHLFSVSDALECGFHESCAETIFKCDSKGFHMGYSKPRCEAVKKFRKSSSDCPLCFNHQEIVDFAHNTEECFQPRLRSLANTWANKVKPLASPDPQNCIDYEIEALKELKTCYENGIAPICDLMSEEVDQSIVADLEKLVSAETVSDYYKPLVHEHLKNLISQCPAKSASDTAAKALPIPTKRILFCAVSDDEDILSYITNKLELHATAEEFVYADDGLPSEIRDKHCQEESPPPSSGGSRDRYRLVQWTPTNYSFADKITQDFVSQRTSATNVNLFFMLTEKTTSCGNGLREVGEFCDTFAEMYIPGNKGGCDQSCQPFDNFECSPKQLTKTSCTKSQCGDGLRSSLEECDDGNESDGDGCSSECKIEDSSECTHLSYNTTSSCIFVEQSVKESTIPATVPSTAAVKIQPSVSLPTAPSSSWAVTSTTDSSSVVPIVTGTPTAPEPTAELHQPSSGATQRTSSLSMLWLAVAISVYLLLWR